MFNVESEAELDAIARVAAAMDKVAPIALRVNPDVDPKTHRYISTGKKESKFGMDIERSLRLAAAAVAMMPSVPMIGMHMHIGSQITTVEPYAGRGGQGRRADRPAARDGSSDRVVQHGRRVRDRLQGKRGAADRASSPA